MDYMGVRDFWSETAQCPPDFCSAVCHSREVDVAMRKRRGEEYRNMCCILYCFGLPMWTLFFRYDVIDLCLL